MTKQTVIDFGKVARDNGITQAITNADRVHDDWSSQAYRFFEIWLRTKNGSFMAEEFRNHVSGVLPDPPSKRAFGGVILKAAKAGLIRRVGYGSVNNIKAHACFASIWKRRV